MALRISPWKWGTLVLKHLTDFTDEDWYHAHHIMYDEDVNREMGAQEVLQNPLTLVSFYEHSVRSYNRGILNGWLIFSDDEPVGYVVLDKRNGEWELGVAIQNKNNRNKGIGVRASLQAMQWAFEEDDSEWVTAYTQGTNTNVPKMMERMGFRRLYHLWVFDKATWNERWSGRVR